MFFVGREKSPDQHGIYQLFIVSLVNSKSPDPTRQSRVERDDGMSMREDSEAEEASVSLLNCVIDTNGEKSCWDQSTTQAASQSFGRFL